MVAVIRKEETYWLDSDPSREVMIRNVIFDKEIVILEKDNFGFEPYVVDEISDMRAVIIDEDDNEKIDI